MIGSSQEEAQRANKVYAQQYDSKFDITAREINTQLVQVTPFDLARYLVTNAQFKQFIDANSYQPDAPWWSAVGRAWLVRDDLNTAGLALFQQRQHKDRPEFWADLRFGIARSNHPVVGVSWYEAMAFCVWLTLYLDDGYTYTLPSEAEWEFAARGAEHWMYAWGDSEPNDERANFNRQYNGTTAVGCFPSGATLRASLLDLSGNVWEWTRSTYRPYPYDLHDGREGNSDSAQKRFTLRGGAWPSQSFGLRSAHRYYESPDSRNNDIGFRIVRHPLSITDMLKV